jgi:hypothetical protein
MNIHKPENQPFILSGTAERDANRRIFEFYIGIDPDLKESGFAIWDKKYKILSAVETLPFFKLYQYLNDLKISLAAQSFVVHVEGGWLNYKSNFREHKNQFSFSLKEKRVSEKISKNVGNNHAVGLLIVEMCIHLDISFLVRKPIAPRFKDEIMFKAITRYKGRTNADARSAANYVYGY